MSRILIIGNEQKQQITELRKRASDKYYTYNDMLARARGAATPGDLEDFTIYLPDRFKVVYTVEQDEDRKFYKHLSASIVNPDPGRVISVDAVRAIILEFEFSKPLEQCMVFTEDIGDGNLAVNVIEPLE